MQVAPGLVGPAGLRTARRDELAPPYEPPKAQGSYPITSDGSRCALQHDRSAASEDANVAVCVLPGTELSFSSEVTCQTTGLLPWRNKVVKHTTAIFRQVNKQRVAAHHDALEFADGQIVLLTLLAEGQQATVLQLPAEPKTADEREKQKRATYVG